MPITKTKFIARIVKTKIKAAAKEEKDIIRNN